MLCLTRKPSEEIFIGEEIRIVVQRIRGNRVSIGVEAPGDCRIVRGELPRYSESSAPSISIPSGVNVNAVA